MGEFSLALGEVSVHVLANGFQWPWLSQWSGWQYVTEGTGNTLVQLGCVVVGALGWFMVRLVLQKRRASRARKLIPLVIGGSGSRGKSGTERCKAAVFSGFGAEVLCKTTGARAQLLHAVGDQRPVEYPEFRPGNHPSLDEQVHALHTASELGCQVLLYESNALTPRSLEVYQDHWMRDDYSTLTNTLADHEDFQGPAGVNIAESLAGFLPKNARAWTSEYEMYPILEEAARRKGTQLYRVPARAAAMLPPDVLERFPYPEHPENIALVLAFTQKLGLDEGFVLREMAANIVPDFGALRTFPEVRVGARMVAFSNLMSANGAKDTLDALGRLKALRMDSREHAGAWLVMMLNNRSDRAAREKAFASLIARRLPAHAIVIGGDNIKRMMEEVDRELVNYANQWRITGETHVSRLRARVQKDFDRLGVICSQDGDLERVTARMMGASGILGTVTEVMFRSAMWIKISQAAVQVKGLRSERDTETMLDAWAAASIGLSALLDEKWQTINKEDCARQDWIEASECLAFIKRFWMQLRAAKSMAKEVFDCAAKEPIPEGLSDIYSEFLTQVLRGRILPVDTNAIDEEEVLRRVIQDAPPGFRVHICGLQNVQGFGRKLINLWMGVQDVKLLIDRLDDSEAKIRNGALNEIRDRTEYRFFEVLAALHGLRLYREQAKHSDAMIQSEMIELIANLEATLEQLEAEKYNLKSNGLRNLILACARVLWFVPLSLWRIVRYKRILDDLKHQRISRKRAAIEMRLLDRS